MTPYVLVLGGVVALLVGGEYLVRGSVAVARRLSIPALVIGLTLVGFGTSMPELATSIQAALHGAPGIAVGNVVGSNIANVLLILGFAALLMPIPVDRRTFRRDGTCLVLATGLCMALAWTGTFQSWQGWILLAGLGGFLWLAFKGVGNGGDVYEHEAEAVAASATVTVGLLQFLGGLIVVLIGARLLVTGAVDIATAWASAKP